MSEPLWPPRTDASARLLGLGGTGRWVLQGRSIPGAIARGEAVSAFAAAVALGQCGVLPGLASAALIGGTLPGLPAWLRSLGYDA